MRLLYLLLVSFLAISCNQNKESSAQESYDSALNDVSTDDLEQLLKQSQPAEDIKDDEFKLFANTYFEIKSANDSTEVKMISAIEATGMTLERFNTIARSQQGGENANITADEQSKLESISGDFLALQVAQDSLVNDIIIKNGLTLPRYQSLLIAVQQDQALQQKLIKLLEGKIETH